MEADSLQKMAGKMEKEVIPSMIQKMNSVIASASLLKNIQVQQKRVAISTNQN